MNVIAITGPAGVGKSTIAKMLAREFPKCVNIDVDHVKHMIASGFKYDESAEGQAQWQLLGDNIGGLAKNYLSSGYDVIINGYLDVASWQRVAQYVQLQYKILLWPHHGAAKKRDKERVQEDQTGAATIDQHYEYFHTNPFYGSFTRLDTTILTPYETIQSIHKLMARTQH